MRDTSFNTLSMRRSMRIDQLLFLAHFFPGSVRTLSSCWPTPRRRRAHQRSPDPRMRPAGGLNPQPRQKAHRGLRVSGCRRWCSTPPASRWCCCGGTTDDFECVQPGIRGSVTMSAAQVAAGPPGRPGSCGRWCSSTPAACSPPAPPAPLVLGHLGANKSIYGWALLATTVLTNVFAAVIPSTMSVYDRVVPNNAPRQPVGAHRRGGGGDPVRPGHPRCCAATCWRRRPARPTWPCRPVFAQGAAPAGGLAPGLGRGARQHRARDFESVREFVTLVHPHGAGRRALHAVLPWCWSDHRHWLVFIPWR